MFKYNPRCDSIWKGSLGGSAIRREEPAFMNNLCVIEGKGQRARLLSQL